MNGQAMNEQRLNPFPWYRTMRESAPVFFDPRQQIWGIFRYDDVQRVLSNYAQFSSAFRGAAQDSSNLFAASMISSDPPRHRQLRTLVTQAFTPRAVDSLAPRITEIVHDLLERVSGKGRMDVIDDLSYPLPVIVIAELLGIPAEDRERFKRWSDATVAMAGTAGTAIPEHPSVAQREMGAYFVEMIERRRREPADDLISRLLAAQIDDQHLTLPELLGFCTLLLVAGNETTTNLIANAILCFTEQPGVLERLRAQPELLPNAIEEVLRYRSPVQNMFRTAAVETTVADQSIPRGARVLAWIGSANRDEAQFPDADRFDVDRSPNRHLAFGNGIHYCLGAPLARLEAQIALGAMLERLPNLRRVPDAALDPLASVLVYGVQHLPITFDRR